MKERDDAIIKNDNFTKEIDLEMQTSLNQSLEERDLKLLNALTHAIKDKSSKEKVDLLYRIIETIQTKNK